MTFTTRPEITGTFGVAASTHWIATAVGMGILERGGNAFDAAVAMGMVLTVVEPHLNGPLGDLPGIICPAGATEPTVICAQGVAPAGATIAHYRAQPEAAGIAIGTEMTTNGNRMLAGEGSDGLTFMVNVSGEDDESTIMLTVGRGSQ